LKLAEAQYPAEDMGSAALSLHVSVVQLLFETAIELFECIC
jgi:hypothetical protein